MELTEFGLLLLPISLWFGLRPLRLLQISLIASVFGAAAALVIQGLGLPPGLPPAVLFIAFVAMQYALGVRYPGERAVFFLLEPLAIAVAYALLTSVILPRAFAGQFVVWPQKVEAGFSFPIQLGPTRSNYTQDLYLLSNVAVTAFGAVFLTRSDIDFRKVLHTWWAGALVVAAVSLWQLASRTTGIFFPETFFYSNPGWVIFQGQEFGSVLRTNGPFSEPAALAYYLSGIIYSCGWVLVRGHRSRFALFLLPVAIATQTLSTSTTGYVVLGGGGMFLLVYALTVAPKELSARILKYGVPFGVLLVVGVLAMASLDTGFARAVDEVVGQTLAKSQGSSYDERTSVDSESLAIMWPSLGLGAGWGSVRSSSLVPGLLANLGIPGVLPVLWFVWRVWRGVRRGRRLTNDPGRLLVIDAASGGLTGTLAAAVISSPTISNVDFYLLLGVLLGCVGRVEFEAERRAVPVTVREGAVMA